MMSPMCGCRLWKRWTSRNLRDKLVQFDKQGLHKLVLDLRDCTQWTSSGRYNCRAVLPLVRQNASLEGQTVPRKEFSAEPDKVVLWRFLPWTC